MKIPKLKLIERDAWLVEACRGKRVLHIGCADYPIIESRIRENRLLHKRLSDVAADIAGLDIDGDGIRRLSILMPGKMFIEHNAENLEECTALRGRYFDIILAADVLEHLSNVGLFLKGVRQLLQPEGRLLITTPQAFAIKRFLGLMFLGVEHVHADHTAYYSISTLEQMLSLHDLRTEEIYGFQWRNPTVRNWLANTAVSPFLWLSRGRLCDELALAIKAR